MAQYLLSVHRSEADPTPSPEVMERMQPVSTATVVDATDEEVVTTDGPFAESKEHLGGFWVVKADDPGRGPRTGATGI